ncbi:hypothetical protein MASR2M70_17500 [Bacillota bacterium]
MSGCGTPADKGTNGGDDEKLPLEGELTEIIEDIYGITGIDQSIAVETVPIDLTNTDSVRYNMGLEDVSKVKEAVVSEALISSQAYSMVLARVNDASDAEELAKEMKEGIDQQKWICVVADDISVVTYDDVVMLIMVSSAMEDVTTSKAATDAFKKICGHDFDVVL